ncbi:3-(3-hydroxy-phenyl)propionate/3-hydroxycinnamic acid hydroxylase [Purpureocillium lavendulum]|uniref:3-(3-hydroxy-phenyl)propionate/3-hydroxycinnamic acid hydroxylase n=1 Tax=Purpureocillium lavendulum TaxID=1247861 RepID=A0AB34FPB3_9HYPO|nr:3-(3-hydroxy-phenyl)propionate/3-hydroxycinnamic acid hydroxylase [Purpureocillium lavendulum]
MAVLPPAAEASPHDGGATLEISPPATTSPGSPPIRSVTDRVATPLSLFLDCSPSNRGGNGYGFCSGKAGADASASDGGVPHGSATTGHGNSSSSNSNGNGGSGGYGFDARGARADPFATMSPAETPEPAVSPVVDAAAAGVGGARNDDSRRSHAVANPPAVISAPGSSARASASRATHGYEPPSAAEPRDHCHQMTKPNVNSPPGLGHSDGEHHPYPHPYYPHSQPPPPPHSHHPPLSDDAHPLRTASVRADTKIAHPKPISRPVSVGQPISDPKLRTVSSIGNVAHLEATAERLSMTSSIDDAIRDLHGELKRSDSRRSSILAASVRAASSDVANDTYTASSDAASAIGPVKRHLSTSSSIVSTNIAARQGGYSPAAFVMSPNHSLTTGRLRSGSQNSTGRPDLDIATILSRHGPGKSSVRSARSAKMSLAEISESEPVSLTGEALDAADNAPPIEDEIDESELRIPPADDDVPSTDAFHEMLGDSVHRAPQTQPEGPIQERHSQDDDDEQRPATSHSSNTFQQCQDAFVDFDGVHWEPEPEEDPYSYFDPETGQQMLYYPARVPAMLNLPPKLSNRPKVTQRNERRSQVLSAMLDLNTAQPPSPEKRDSTFDLNAQLDKRGSTFELGKKQPKAAQRASFLPDPVAGQRNSFDLSQFDFAEEKAKSENGGDQEAAEPDATAADPRPVSGTEAEKRKSKMSMLLKLPPQLRASAFFDLPPTNAVDVEIKDGSAMATLDSILDASASAPVSAFTDHVYGGKLGTEVYGKTKKQKARQSTATLTGLSPNPEPKKRSSFMWLGKRATSSHTEEKQRPHTVAGPADLDRDKDDEEAADAKSTGGDSADNVIRVGVDQEEADGEEESEEDEDAYHGPPTTLLAELQLRKQEQQQRKKNLGSGFANGMHATLLEMDTVAEQQRKERNKKRVNLAWEDPLAHTRENGSDDEDVPLAVLAAMQQGAKNMADLERPVGLLERRDREDNEPLSHRRARLQGLEPPTVILPNRMSVMSFPAFNRGAQNRSPHSVRGQSPVPEEEEADGETLEERRRRLTGKDSNSELPRARPVSSTFSAELLSQFGDLDEPKEKAEESKDGKTPVANGEDETLGQRRRRLQAEREAREREMSYGNLVGDPVQKSNRLSLANILSAHPKKEPDMQAQEHMQRVEDARGAVEREAKLAAMRKQMPQTLEVPKVDRAGGFRGGVFNDGTGGSSLLASKNEYETRMQEQRLRAEEDQRAARLRDAKMAAMREQMPQTLNVPTIERSGGFRGGAFNDGSGGIGLRGARSSQSLNVPGIAQGGFGYQNRSSVVLNSGSMLGGPVQQPMYDGMGNMAAMNPMGPYNGLNAMGSVNNLNAMGSYNNLNAMGSSYNLNAMGSYNNMNAMGGFYNGNAGMSSYGGNMMAPGMQMQMQMPMQAQMPMPLSSGSVDRVEQWRRSVHP